MSISCHRHSWWFFLKRIPWLAFLFKETGQGILLLHHLDRYRFFLFLSSQSPRSRFSSIFLSQQCPMLIGGLNRWYRHSTPLFRSFHSELFVPQIGIAVTDDFFPSQRTPSGFRHSVPVFPTPPCKKPCKSRKKTCFCIDKIQHIGSPAARCGWSGAFSPKYRDWPAFLKKGVHP